MNPNKDWDSYDNELSELWSGISYDYDITKVSEDAYSKLLEEAEKWYAVEVVFSEGELLCLPQRII